MSVPVTIALDIKAQRQAIAWMILSRNFVRGGVPQEDGRLFGEVVLITENAE